MLIFLAWLLNAGFDYVGIALYCASLAYYTLKALPAFSASLAPAGLASAGDAALSINGG